MGIIVLLSELIGEAIHIVLISASQVGALVSDIRVWLKSRCK